MTSLYLVFLSVNAGTYFDLINSEEFSGFLKHIEYVRSM